MIKIIWEFQVDSSQLNEFEQAYDSQGYWASFFKQSKKYHGTQLIKDISIPGRYFTIDQWDDLEAFENFKSQNISAYQKLDNSCEKLTLAECKIGIFIECS